jgi:Glycosyl hydrolase family 76
MTTFKDAAVQGFNTLVGLWNHGNTFQNCSGGGCFWMAGNLFHTAVDSMSRAGLQDTNNIGQEALDYFGGFIKDTTDPRNWRQEYGFWVDDYGWWGIAFMHAYFASDKLGYDSSRKEQFAANAKNCWEALNACWDNSPITWQKDGKSYTITGGIPNTLDDVTLAGRNCVTNECYWCLSGLLGRTFGEHYLDPNANADDFFLQAQTQGILFDGSGLVYERFLGLPNTQHPDWTWLGDQGLFAISCYYNSQGTSGVFDQTQAKSIIAAVQTDRKTASGVLHEDLAPYDQFRLDYACGKGTFMRNLAYVNDDLHDQFPEDFYDPYIQLNAQALWRNRQPGGIFPYYWDAESPEPTSWGYSQTTANAVLHAAGLSAINAALPWIQDQSID